MRQYSFSERMINDWIKFSNDRVTASSVNMFKNTTDRYLIKVSYTHMKNYLHTYEKCLDSCPFTVWSLLLRIVILQNNWKTLIFGSYTNTYTMRFSHLQT